MADEKEKLEATRFFWWTVGLGVVFPVGGYFALVAALARQEGLAGPINRGQFYLTSTALIVLAIRTLNEANFANAQFERFKEVHLVLNLAALIAAGVTWALITIESIETSGQLSDGWKLASWLGVVLMLGAVVGGRVAIGIAVRGSAAPSEQAGN